MVAAIGLLLPGTGALSIFGVGLTTAAGGLTLAGSLFNIGASMLLNYGASALMRGSTPPPENVKGTSKATTAPRVAHYGVVKVGGNIVFHRAHEGTTYRLVVHGHGKINQVLQTYLNDVPVSVDASGFVTDEKYFYERPRVQIFRRKGLIPETSYGEITAIWSEWTSNHRLDEQWTSLIKREGVPPEQYRKMYPNSEPVLSQAAETALCFDPRTGLTEFSDNAALIIADFIGSKTGMGRVGVVDVADQIKASDFSDTPRNLATGGSEPKYRISGSYLLNERPADVLSRMLAACAGQVWLKPNGKVGLSVGVWEPPTFTLKYSQIIQVGNIDGGPDRLDRYNTLPARYTDRGLGFIEVDAEPFSDASRVADDGGEILMGPDYPAIMSPSHAQTRQVMKIAIDRDNPKKTIRIVCHPSALEAFYERVIFVDVPELGIVGNYAVTNQSISMDGGNISGITLSLREVDPSAFDLSLSEQGSPQEIPAETVSAGIPLPQSVVAVGEGVQISQNSFSAGIGVGWQAPPYDSLIPILRYRKTGVSDWSDHPVGATVTNIVIVGLVDGQSYDISLAFASADAVKGDDVVVLNVTASAATTPPLAPTGLTVTDLTGGVASVKFTTSASDTLWKTEIYRDSGSGYALIAVNYDPPSVDVEVVDACGAGLFDWKVRSVNVSGKPSDTDLGPVSQTIS